MRFLSAVLLTAALAACSPPPSEKIGTVDHRPALQIVGAPYGSRLFVDGLDLGAPSEDRPLLLEPGTHRIVVEMPGGRRHEEKIFISGAGMKSIRVSGSDR